MKPAIATRFFLCVAAVSASILPNPILKRQQLVDLAQFGEGFHTISLEEAQAAAAKNNAEHADLLDSVTADAKTAGGVAAESEDGTVTIQAGTCTAPATRIEWRSLSDAQKTAFLQAVKCLINLPPSGAFSSAGSQNRYEDLVAVHAQMVNTIHMFAQFLPWHRYYYHIFELMLREECSYTGPMTWWNEPLDAGNFRNSPLFTTRWFGTAPLKTASGQGTCLQTGNGFFGGTQLHVGGGSYCLSRALDESATAQCNSNFVNSCNSNNLYSDMESCSEYGPHGYGHNGVGAVMSNVALSPGDPVFFMHHGFVDHSWAIWQNADPANRLYQINGCSNSASPCAQLTTSYVLSSQGLRPDVTVNDVMDTQGGYLCYVYDS